MIEATDVAAAIPGQFDPLRDRGRLAVPGRPRDATEFDFYEHCHLASYETVGAHVGTRPRTVTPETP